MLLLFVHMIQFCRKVWLGQSDAAVPPADGPRDDARLRDIMSMRYHVHVPQHIVKFNINLFIYSLKLYMYNW